MDNLISKLLENNAPIDNPIYLYGEQELNKAQLMKKIACFMARQSADAKVIYVTGQEFITLYYD